MSAWMSRPGRFLKRLFTHPYGACRIDGCDRPRERWAGMCPGHISAAIRLHARERARVEFDRHAEIVAEGIRRAMGES